MGAFDHLDAVVALPLNAGARERLSNDAKLSHQFETDRAWILAALGRRDEALAAASQAELRMARVAPSRGAQVGCLYCLGRAYAAMEDWERTRGAWKRFLDIKPDPVDVPKGHYFLAQALRGLGRTDEAREALRQAAEGPAELHHTRLAARELAE